MRTFYLDASVAVHALLGTAAAERWFDRVTAAGDELLSSRILQTELTRALRRERLPVARRDEILDHVALIRLTEGVLAGAEAITDHLRTLDAIHLASALSVGSSVVMTTHDVALGRVSDDAGLRTIDPVDHD